MTTSPMPRLDDRTTGFACAIASVILFSSFTLASRLGLSASLKWTDLAALRFGVGGLALLPVLLKRGLSGVNWRDAGLLALFGGVGFAVLAYAGFSLAPAAHGAVLLHGTLPLTTFALLRATRQPAAYAPTGLALIGIGIVLMAYDSARDTSPVRLLGDGLLLLASASWSAYGVLLRRLDLSALYGAAIVAVFSMCCFLPIYALLPGKLLLTANIRDVLPQFIVQGVLIGVISISVYSRAVASLGPATTALFTAAVPCLTTLAAVTLLGERPSLAGAIGVGVVTLGMIVTVPRTRS